MKRILTFLTLLISVSAVAAEKVEETPSHIKFYGFIRNFTAFDTRDSKAGTEDLYYYVPLDRKLTAEGVDLNENLSFRNLAITSRFGLDILGYSYGNLKVNGKIEADFYSMNGSTAIFRLRQAYANFEWPNDNLSLTVGQKWHPLGEDLPHVIDLESGAPFNPFNRSPQFTFNWKNGGFALTASAITQMQYLSVGPDSTAPTVATSSTTEIYPFKVGKSENYLKYSLIPEIYLGMSYSQNGLLAKAGVDILSIKPRWKDGNGPVEDRLTTVSPFAYLQYKKGLFQIKAKTILAEAGEHLNLLTGYGAYDVSESSEWKYTPMKSSASFVSASYGKKWQILGMIGYAKLLGTTEDLFTNGEGKTYYWFNNSAPSNFTQMIRFTPTLTYNVGKVSVGVEYDLTGVEYGSNMNSRGIVTDDLHWVINNRILTMVKFTF